MPTETYLSDRDLANKYGVHRVTPWKWVQAGRFPQPVKLGPGCTRWRASDVEAWEAERLAEAGEG